MIEIYILSEDFLKVLYNIVDNLFYFNNSDKSLRFYIFLYNLEKEIH